MFVEYSGVLYMICMFAEYWRSNGAIYEKCKKRVILLYSCYFISPPSNFGKHIFAEAKKEGENLWITVLWTIC